MPTPFCYDYPRPAVTVDLALFSFEHPHLQVLLIKRGKPPFEGQWALPGGFLNLREPAATGARRELLEETGIKLKSTSPLHPLGFFDAPDRDPRDRVISLSFAAVLSPPTPEPKGGDDAQDARWVPIDQALGLAFDHHLILNTALVWLRAATHEGPTGATLLPRRFTREEPRALLHALHGHARSLNPWLRRLQTQHLIKPAATTKTPDTYTRLTRP